MRLLTCITLDPSSPDGQLPLLFGLCFLIVVKPVEAAQAPDDMQCVFLPQFSKFLVFCWWLLFAQ